MEQRYYYVSNRELVKDGNERTWEPLLMEDEQTKYVFKKGTEDSRVEEFYILTQASLWTQDEIYLGDDVRHWNEQLKPSEKFMFEGIFAFFFFGDGLVIGNLGLTFLTEIQNEQIKTVYCAQIYMESVHLRTYKNIMEALIRDKDRLNELQNMFCEDPTFVEFKRFTEQFMDSKKHCFASRLLAFACFEGITFSGSFACIYWLKRTPFLPGVVFSNELISRDEGLHCDFACYLYSERIRCPLPYDEALNIITQFVEMSQKLMNVIIPEDIIGFNKRLMGEYLEFIGNRLFRALSPYEGCKDPFPGTKNPLDWMEFISLQRKTNFFETQVSEYSMSNTVNSPHLKSRNARLKGKDSEKTKKEIETDDNVFTTEADF